jgi:hypothetical protein
MEAAFFAQDVSLQQGGCIVFPNAHPTEDALVLHCTG